MVTSEASHAALKASNGWHARSAPNIMPPSGKIEVAEEGNRRKGEMTPSEMRQCAKDIVAWFQQHADLDAAVVIKRHRQLSKKRGAISAGEPTSGVPVSGSRLRLLHPQSIAKMLSDVDAPYVPFARDIDDALLVVQTMLFT